MIYIGKFCPCDGAILLKPWKWVDGEPMGAAVWWIPKEESPSGEGPS